MAESLLASLALVLSPTTLGLMLVGIALGFIVGLLPGLGGAATLALMLPFTFTMAPAEAFPFLLGMTAVTATTGDITSILFGVPGEPTTAATIVDGHPMAKNGEAGRALGAALAASLIGALFGAAALALAIPVVRPLVLSLGSPELLMLAILGLTFVASLSGERMLRGLIAAGLGLLLGTIGLDPLSGTPRYTFGELFLWDGIGLVPATIGLFAIPEVVELAVRRSAIARSELGRLGDVMKGIRDSFRHGWLVLRCSALGTYIGIIPGMGGGISQWLAYAHAVQSSPGKERFGKGAVEGVLGPGAANNSTLGGSLIPTIAFGVPGSVTTAILLGAFVVQGLTPGPDMLLPESRGGHLALTFSFVWTIVIANLVSVATCFLFLGQLARLTHVRGSLLIPPVILLVCVGAFAEKHAFQDLYLVLLFGLIGWAMNRNGWPRAPLILGLVLGPLAENRLFLSIDNYGLAWLGRPGVLLLFALTVAGVSHALPNWSRNRSTLPGSASSPVFTAAIAVLAGYALWESREFGFRAGLFPWVVGASVLAMAVGLLLLDILRKHRVAPPVDGVPERVILRRTAGIFGWIVGFIAAIWLLGFAMGGALCTFLALKLSSQERWPVALALTAGVWALIDFLFVRALHVPFPPGRVLTWLGIS